MVRDNINPYENTAKLVITTFYKVSKNRKNGVRADDITQYLQNEFGEVWHAQTLTDKAQQVLRQSALLGFLTQKGDRYTSGLTRVVQNRGVKGGCRRRRQRRRRGCCRRRCCPRRRRSKKQRVCSCCTSNK